MKRERSSDLTPLIEAFQRLSVINDLIRFHVEFENEQRESGLRLSTFKSAWTAWKTEASPKKIETKGEDV